MTGARGTDLIRRIEAISGRYPAWWPQAILATWFLVISAMRLQSIATIPPGFDGRLYRVATITWLDGGDPWTVFNGPIRYAAPPPSLLAMVPFTWVPEDVAVGLIIVLGLLGTLWAIRRLRLPLWWIAFPPFIDGLYNANPHVLILPLLVAGAAPIAVLVKIYAGVVPLVRGDLRAVLLSAALLVVTIPILPWAAFIDQLPTIMDALRAQASGGMSAWAIPILVPVGVVALLVMGRDRAAWWAVPVLWPSTQLYYTSLVMPAATLLGAFVAAIPSPWAATIASGLVAGEMWIRRRGVLDGTTT